MHHHTRARLVAGAVTVLLATGAALVPTAAHADATATVSGTFRTAAGTVPAGIDGDSRVALTPDHAGPGLEAPTTTLTSIAPDGTWSFTGVAPDSYDVVLRAQQSPQGSWVAQDEHVVVGNDGAATQIAFVSDRPTVPVVSVHCADCGTGTTLTVTASQYENGRWGWAGTATVTDGVPTRAFGILRDGNPTRFIAVGPDGRSAMSAPVDLAVSAGDVPIDLTLAHPVTERVAGPDRFATSVAASEASVGDAPAFPAGVPVAFVASGVNYPDALSAGPAAAHLGGPLLLTAPNALPAAVTSELRRLRPQRVVVVGGTASVSDTVVRQVESAVGTAVGVQRVSGADRYATSRAVAEYAFPNGAEQASVATGTAFADALGGGSAAAALGGPLLLVNGGAGSADAATLAELATMHTKDVTILGGTDVVTQGVQDGIAQQLGALNGFSNIARQGGDDRYDTSVQANSVFTGDLGTPQTAMLALGTNFPDALSGTALAGKLGIPLYTSPAACVPAATLDAIASLGVQHVLLLGGPAGLTTAIDSLTEC